MTPSRKIDEGVHVLRNGCGDGGGGHVGFGRVKMVVLGGTSK